MVTEPETTFGYAVVEKALMAVHDFAEQKRGAFRGRLVHFQRLKIVPAAPGKGRRIAYRREDVFRWAIALEFAEFGIDPTEIKKIMDMNWHHIVNVVLEATDRPDRYLFFHPSLLGRLSLEGERETFEKPGAPYTITIKIVFDLDELNQQAKHRSGARLCRSLPGAVRHDQLEPSPPAGRRKPHRVFPSSPIRTWRSTAFRIARVRALSRPRPHDKRRGPGTLRRVRSRMIVAHPATRDGPRIEPERRNAIDYAIIRPSFPYSLVCPGTSAALSSPTCSVSTTRSVDVFGAAAARGELRRSYRPLLRARESAAMRAARKYRALNRSHPSVFGR